MFTQWNNTLTEAIRTLPPLHREIITKTMALRGKHTRLFYSEAQRFWNLDRKDFDEQRGAAVDTLRKYLVERGLVLSDYLALE